MRIPFGLLASVVVGCTNLPDLEIEARQVVRLCTGEFVDAGHWHFLDEVHISNVEFETATIAGAVASSSADGGVCIRSEGGPGGFEICRSPGSICRRGSFVSPGIDVVRAIAFGPVPVGVSVSQTIRVYNRTSRAARLTLSLSRPDFSSVRELRVASQSSAALLVGFVASRVGDFDGTLTLESDWGERSVVLLSGSGDGPLISVQSFVDAGVLSLVPGARDVERRGLRITNIGGLLPLSASPTAAARVVRCLPTEAIGFLGVRRGPLPALSMGESYVADLFITPGLGGLCRVEFDLAGVTHPVDLLFEPMNHEWCRLHTPAIALNRSQSIYQVPVRPLDGRCYLSWPRVSSDGGLTLSSDWSEAILDPTDMRMVTLAVDWSRFNSEAELRIDGNAPAGYFRWEVVQQ